MYIGIADRLMRIKFPAHSGVKQGRNINSSVRPHRILPDRQLNTRIVGNQTF